MRLINSVDVRQLYELLPRGKDKIANATRFSRFHRGEMNFSTFSPIYITMVIIIVSVLSTFFFYDRDSRRGKKNIDRENLKEIGNIIGIYAR